jgi:hypothetical protein
MTKHLTPMYATVELSTFRRTDHEENRTQEASELGWSPGVLPHVLLVRDGEREFQYVADRIDRDREGDIQAVVYAVVLPTATITECTCLTVYND